MSDYLNFKHESGFSQEQFDRLMDQYPGQFTEHLVLGKLIERWAKRFEMDKMQYSMLGEGHVEGFINGLRHVKDYLQQGDFMPGESMHESLAGDESKKLDEYEFKHV
ncbi:hypothetical protein BG28_06625 [Nesterenkonia sp. AN1]|uniref:hypothetical protein n=1 Tax=Nesterenkonia sp. AN1 TaxID=652017 RepID=UPI00044FC0AA|nr:hypothetical protein [Nesterenkonia sp. AN1]EXF24380.1 hypothetical protein BG28_06625 [Nesterenkonia sp. AN1]